MKILNFKVKFKGFNQNSRDFVNYIQNMKCNFTKKSVEKGIDHSEIKGNLPKVCENIKLIHQNLDSYRKKAKYLEEKSQKAPLPSKEEEFS